jgi:3-hydroxyacyl-[acyl-carrier-protein] dehydratase
MSARMSDDRSALVALLPHRAPFLFVDDVDDCQPAVSIRAHYRVTGAEPFLGGHFPGNPIFPGVLQLESLAQAGAIAVLADARFAGKLPLFGGVEDARFRRLVRPDDVLDLAVDIERVCARGGWGRGVASVAGAECCRARLLFAFA